MTDKATDATMQIIAEKLTSIDTKLDFLHKDYTKLMFGMMAIVGATVGLKIMGTPPITIIATYTAVFCMLFLLLVVALRWKYLSWSSRLVRGSFALFTAYSVICRETVMKRHIAFEVGFPQWYLWGIDAAFTIVCLIMAITAWIKWETK